MSSYDTWLETNPAEASVSLKEATEYAEERSTAIAHLGMDIVPLSEGGFVEGWTLLLDGQEILDIDWEGLDDLIRALDETEGLEDRLTARAWLGMYSTRTENVTIYPDLR